MAWRGVAWLGLDWMLLLWVSHVPESSVMTSFLSPLGETLV